MKNRLEELRKARGIKQEELAEALEVSSDDWLPGERAVQSLYSAGVQAGQILWNDD